jgi:hypothetical protein
MDVLGMRAISKGAHALGLEPPAGRHLYNSMLAGDLLANTVYYALVGVGRAPVRTGLALGAAAGVGALVLPRPLGLGRPPHAAAPANRVMTVAWYVIGGIVAGAVRHALTTPTKRLPRGRRRPTGRIADGTRPTGTPAPR